MKLNKLVPIVALTSITSIVTPVITSCTHGNVTPKIILLDNWDETSGSLLSNEYSFEKGIIYVAKADWKDIGETGYFNWTFGAVNMSAQESFNLVEDNAKFWLNDDEYTLSDISGEFYFVSGFFAGTHSATFTDNDHFTFQFQVAENGKANLHFGLVAGNN